MSTRTDHHSTRGVRKLAPPNPHAASATPTGTQEIALGDGASRAMPPSPRSGSVSHQAHPLASEILGHSSIAITGDVYGHVSPDVAWDAVRTLGEVLANLGRANGGHNGGQIASGKEQGRSRSSGNGP